MIKKGIRSIIHKMIRNWTGWAIFFWGSRIC